MSLEQKFELYSKAPAGQYGWHQDDCDALLFESLRGCVKGQEPTIDAAFNGVWWRRPHAWDRSCYDPKLPQNDEGFLTRVMRILALKVWNPLVDMEEIIQANWWKGSTISRDMLVGLAWYAWTNKRLDISEDVIEFALKHGGRMGYGDPSRTNIMPALLATFAMVSASLGGPKRKWLTWIPLSGGHSGVGFEAHLAVLHALLRGKIRGYMTKSEREMVTFHWNRQSYNPLFAIAAGKTQHAQAILAAESLWPSDRLPTNHDRKESWLPQRDHGSDWVGDISEPKHQHPGSDFLFCYALLTGRLKNE